MTRIKRMRAVDLGRWPNGLRRPAAESRPALPTYDQGDPGSRWCQYVDNHVLLHTEQPVEIKTVDPLADVDDGRWFAVTGGKVSIAFS